MYFFFSWNTLLTCLAYYTLEDPDVPWKKKKEYSTLLFFLAAKTNYKITKHVVFFRVSRDDNHKQSSVLPEIEFIDVNASQHVDDVFLNLDAFDMLSEFPDLEGLDHNQNGTLFT